jgi:hypothetical protein
LLNDNYNNLFARFDPYKKYSPLFTESEVEECVNALNLRPVWIIGDLITINDWLNAELKKSNWQLNKSRITVLQHYKQILLSDYAQSFMIEQNGSQIMQVDLLPVRLVDYMDNIEFENSDYVIHFLYKERFRDPDIFEKCLGFIVPVFFTSNEIDTLYLRLQKVDTIKQEFLTRMGFEAVNLFNFFGKSLNINKAKRPGI